MDGIRGARTNDQKSSEESETPPLIEKTPEEKLIEFIQNEKFNDAYALYKQGKVNSEELERAIRKA